jgi:aspartate--ammonia ligase, AsnA-type
MSIVIVPEEYKPVLNLYQTQVAIGNLRHSFQDKLALALNLKRVSAPLFVDPDTGLNDDLSGIERPVSFDIAETGGDAQVVHSLAKWKRMALHNYSFSEGEGLYTDMNAIRRDEVLSNIHSVYVDQWDWEKILPKGQRNIEYLKETVKRIVTVICDTSEELKWQYPKLKKNLERNVSFITTQELEDMYPDKTPKERENLYTQEHKTVCILCIGNKLKSGEKHDDRAPDYDDWQLNCDILFWNDILGRAFEITSMGIRVDAETLAKQLKKADCEDRKNRLFHKMLLNGELPLTIGGGIGQSRICMLLLEKAHIGEVQTSLWDDDTIWKCEAAGIPLL